MATMVLTVVGGAIGGPIGAALGSIAGQAIDRGELFKPKGREGPRLDMLAVQTSTYGAPIPRLFGTMRVAGQVVWATDLKERRDTQGGGKGRPSLTSYSYSASFAVLLSARPIIRVRRIWADGKLLRGAAGDFKTRTGFRLHMGGEDQMPDPLIASAEGIGAAPAMRGCAYAVFEDLELADFGNRIPSLTFEVEADAGQVSLGTIVEDMSAGAVRGLLPQTVSGFSGHGDTLRAAIAPIVEIAGARLIERDGGLSASHGDDAGEIADDGAHAVGGQGQGQGQRGGRDLAMLEAVPRRIAVAHYDPARDYQIGTQAAARGGAGRGVAQMELPAAIAAPDAKLMAESMLARALAGRATRTVRTAWSPNVPGPGATVRVAGDPSVWRVARLTIERLVAELALVRVARGAAVALPASPGAIVREPDSIAGATRLEIFELPPIGDTLLTQPRLHIAGCGGGPGWRGAAVMTRIDAESGWSTAAPLRLESVMGVLEQPLPVAVAGLVDRRSAIEISLVHDGMQLSDADDAALDAGANAALIGDELVQFGRAAPLGGGRWRLSHLWRGRRGTEAAINGQGPGSRFVLIDPAALVTVDLPPEAIGRRVSASASGAGDVAEAVVDRVMSGRSVAPPAPVHARIIRLSDGGLLLSWTRRSRLGWAWRDALDAPIAEEREGYRLTLSPAGAAERTIDVTEPRWTYPAAMRAADLAPGPLAVSIVQIGAHAVSAPLEIMISGDDK